MSSRNSYLSPEERRAASAIPKSLEAAGDAAAKGARDARSIIEKAREVIEREELLRTEYIGLYDPKTLEDVDSLGDGGGRALLAMAVRVGKARLIDNKLI